MREAIISFPGFGITVNPGYCFQIGSFCIYYYGVIIAIGFLLAIFYASRVHKRFDLTMDDVYDYLIWGVIAGVICARLYYCITYVDEAGVHTYFQDPASFLRIRDGGLAIYGGVIGAVIALVVRSRMKKQSVWPILDIAGLGFLIGQIIGRWGNFFNREAYGYETDVFWRMGLTLSGNTIYVHPTFLYESLWNLLGFALLSNHSKYRRRYQGQYFLLYLIWYGFGRAVIEAFRSDSLWLVPGVIRISQLVGLVSAVLALAAYIANAARLKAGKPPVFGKLPASAADEAEDADSPVGRPWPDPGAPSGDAETSDDSPVGRPWPDLGAPSDDAKASDDAPVGRDDLGAPSDDAEASADAPVGRDDLGAPSDDTEASDDDSVGRDVPDAPSGDAKASDDDSVGRDVPDAPSATPATPDAE